MNRQNTEGLLQKVIHPMRTPLFEKSDFVCRFLQKIKADYLVIPNNFTLSLSQVLTCHSFARKLFIFRILSNIGKFFYRNLQGFFVHNPKESISHAAFMRVYYGFSPITFNLDIL
jgi:hypothetical protein